MRNAAEVRGDIRCKQARGDTKVMLLLINTHNTSFRAKHPKTYIVYVRTLLTPVTNSKIYLSSLASLQFGLVK